MFTVAYTSTFFFKLFYKDLEKCSMIFYNNVFNQFYYNTRSKCKKHDSKVLLKLLDISEIM